MPISKRILSWGLSILFLLEALLPIATTAQAVAPEEVIAEKCIISDASLPGNDALFEIYLEHMFYPADSVSFLGELARNQLTDKGQKLYDFLKANLLAVSSGASSSTVFHLSAEQITSWNGTVSYEKNSAQTAQEAANAALMAFIAEFELENVLTALLHDCPYELYWYDKVTGAKETGLFTLSGNSCNISSVAFMFAVVADMQAENYSSTAPAFDTSTVAAAAAAAKYAQDLVASLSSKTDYEKLIAYQEEICSLVNYDKAAASGGNFSTDADPWQLTYVFDGNPFTNVVCEGYAKAFQYLYDLSDFNSNIGCISVTGTLAGTGHMWNIVSVNNQNYLVDITSCDSSVASADRSFFLAGATGSISNGYVVNSQTYVYDTRTKNFWGIGENSRLRITDKTFTPCEFEHVEVIDAGLEATCTAAGLSKGAHCAVCGMVLTTQQVIPPKGHSYDEHVVSPTCTEYGYTEYSCRTCGDQYVDQQITALGHSYAEHVISPTCTEYGYTEYSCRTCGDQYVDQQITALGHSWLTATCTAPKTCKICGVQDGLPLDHTYEDGWDTSCEVCGHIRDLGFVLSPMYRLYNPYTHEHLLTSNEAEKDLLIRIGWLFDGIAWKAPSKGKPVYRLYNPFDDWHTYTMSQEEIDMLVPLGWKVDGVVCYSATEPGAKPIYRLFNPYEQKNYHLLTADTAERDLLENAGWIVEGVAWMAAK